MRTFLKMTSARARRGGRALRAHARGPLAAGEEGFLLVEVMVSALLVALIVTATFNGFDAASRLSIDQRRHSEAQLLAAESQEQLRSDSATALSALETATHSYSREIANNGTTTTYKITQEARPLSAKSQTGCSATSASKENGANIEIVSSVTWALIEKAKRPPVKLASIITPPIGSALEVDVTDGGSPAKAVSGVTAAVTYKPVGASVSTVAEATTGAAGCVVFTGLAATSASVEIKEKTGYVIKSGELKFPTKTVTIAPNITTQYPVTYALGGRLTAQFTYKGATTYGGKEVQGDTFVVSNSSVSPGAQFAEGAPTYKIQETGEMPYYPFAGTTSTYALPSTTATATKYPAGDLFPLPSEWTGYAGECPKNRLTGFEGKATVVGGANTTIQIPLAYDQILLKTGSWVSKGGATVDASHYEAKLTFPECAGYELPNHSYGVDREHEEQTTGGELEFPFQPFGKVKLCIYNAVEKKAYYSEFTNSTETYKPKEPLYTGQPPKQEREKREKEEEAMAEAKTSREATESAERTQWQKEKSEGRISEATRLAKVTAQTNSRVTKENEEKTAKTNRETAENKAKGTYTTTKAAEEAFEKETGFKVESAATGNPC